MRTRHQVKIDAVVPSCLPKAWHLDLHLQKGNIDDDLKSLSFIPTIDKLSSSSTQSKRAQVSKIGDNKKRPPTTEIREEPSKRAIEEVKISKEKLKAPCKRRLASKTENDAVENLCKFCKALWRECKC